MKISFNSSFDFLQENPFQLLEDIFSNDCFHLHPFVEIWFLENFVVVSSSVNQASLDRELDKFLLDAGTGRPHPVNPNQSSQVGLHQILIRVRIQLFPRRFS